MSYDALLFLHVLAAFIMVTAVGMLVAITLALRSDRHAATALSFAPLASVLWPVGGLGAIVFGVWLALHVDQYSLTDGWIIAAIVLWVIGSGIGARMGAGYRRRHADGAAAPDSSDLLLSLLLVIAVIAILVDMIYKPGAS
jgi:uncharacterized membrane protein